MREQNIEIGEHHPRCVRVEPQGDNTLCRGDRLGLRLGPRALGAGAASHSRSRRSSPAPRTRARSWPGRASPRIVSSLYTGACTRSSRPRWRPRSDRGGQRQACRRERQTVWQGVQRQDFRPRAIAPTSNRCFLHRFSDTVLVGGINRRGEASNHRRSSRNNAGILRHSVREHRCVCHHRARSMGNNPTPK
jgi:hypothetical protein